MDKISAKQEIALEALETLKDPKAILNVIHLDLKTDIDDPDVQFHLQFNPHVTLTELET